MQLSRRGKLAKNLCPQYTPKAVRALRFRTGVKSVLTLIQKGFKSWPG
jgi:hypothetical protein